MDLESWNIWTHLFGFVVFLWLGARLLKGLDGTAEDTLVFLVFVLSVEASMLSSAIFHAFNCHSPCTYEQLLPREAENVEQLATPMIANHVFRLRACPQVQVDVPT